MGNLIMNPVIKTDPCQQQGEEWKKLTTLNGMCSASLAFHKFPDIMG